MSEPAVGVMRTSADDDDQADQQHNLADTVQCSICHNYDSLTVQCYYQYQVLPDRSDIKLVIKNSC